MTRLATLTLAVLISPGSERGSGWVFQFRGQTVDYSLATNGQPQGEGYTPGPMPVTLIAGANKLECWVCVGGKLEQEPYHLRAARGVMRRATPGEILDGWGFNVVATVSEGWKVE